MPKLQAGTILPGAEPVIVPDKESEPNLQYWTESLSRVADDIKRIALMVDNMSRSVDEHQGAQSFSEQSSSIDVLPDFEAGEMITGIIVTGPPAASLQLTLGSRHWPLIVPASGILVIAPIAIRLDQRDQRNLTFAMGGPGLLGLELMGRIDKQ
jgi:hypothetical protein